MYAIVVDDEAEIGVLSITGAVAFYALGVWSARRIFPQPKPTVAPADQLVGGGLDSPIKTVYHAPEATKPQERLLLLRDGRWFIAQGSVAPFTYTEVDETSAMEWQRQYSSVPSRDVGRAVTASQSTAQGNFDDG